MIRRVLGLTIGLLFACSVSAEIIHFECATVYVQKGTEIIQKMNINMTEKVWETETHTFSDIVISQSAVRASDRWRDGSFGGETVNMNTSMFLSREDLSFVRETEMSMADPPYVSVDLDYRGTCKVVKAPKVERAF